MEKESLLKPGFYMGRHRKLMSKVITEYYFLGYNAMNSGGSSPMFWSNNGETVPDYMVPHTGKWYLSWSLP
jgi:hypothetical protein